MMFPVLKHVDDCMPGRARRRESARVVAFGEYSAAAAQDAVNRAGEPNREPLEAARENIGVVGLDQQVDVIGLHREMHDAEPFARSPPETAPQHRESRLPKGGQLRSDAQRDVRGMGLPVHRTPAMRNGGAMPRRPSRAGTPATAASPLEKVQLLTTVTARFPRLLSHNEKGQSTCN